MSNNIEANDAGTAPTNHKRARRKKNKSSDYFARIEPYQCFLRRTLLDLWCTSDRDFTPVMKVLDAFTTALHDDNSNPDRSLVDAVINLRVRVTEALFYAKAGKLGH
jgi:hypothetical protein